MQIVATELSMNVRNPTVLSNARRGEMMTIQLLRKRCALNFKAEPVGLNWRLNYRLLELRQFC